MKTKKINAKKEQNTSVKECDIAVVGAGNVGMLAALCAVDKGFSVALIDPKLQHIKNKNTLKKTYDRRAVALSPATISMFKKYKLYEGIKKYLFKVSTICVDESRIGDPYQKNIPTLLTLPTQSYDQSPFFMIQSAHLNAFLAQNIVQSKNSLLTSISESVLSEISDHTKLILNTHTDRKIKAKLLIAADGKNSPIRKRAQIQWRHRDYQQSAITSVIKHEYPHNAVALERFFPQGPCAALPLKEYVSAIVWCEETETAHHIIRLPRQKFIYEMEKRFKDKLGKITLLKGEKPQLWPLCLSIAQKIYAQRRVLTGDAAHVIHPLAGLGLNLGFGDIRDLMHILEERQKLGLDIATHIPLHAYQKARMKDIFAVISLTEGLNSLFSNENIPLAVMRKTGLKIINQIPQIKSLLMGEAIKI